eukprot:73348_1
MDEINRKLQIEKNEEKKSKNNDNNNDNDSNTDSEEEEEENEYNNPWNKRSIPFGKWYKSKLKNDLNHLIDLICMAQDVISMKNINDALLMCMELREGNKRLIAIC